MTYTGHKHSKKKKRRWNATSKARGHAEQSCCTIFLVRVRASVILEMCCLQNPFLACLDFLVMHTVTLTSDCHLCTLSKIARSPQPLFVAFHNQTKTVPRTTNSAVSLAPVQPWPQRLLPPPVTRRAATELQLHHHLPLRLPAAVLVLELELLCM